MGVERVAKLIKSHRVRIARALVRQVRALVPRYESVDAIAQERSFLSLLLGVERLLDYGDESPLLEVASHIAQLRVSAGFRIEDFTAASLAFLPVVRGFIIEQAKDVAEGLHDYEEFEEIALPILARAANIFMDASEDPTMPNARLKLKKKLEGQGPMRPLRIERVTGHEDEESTLQNFALPFSIRSTG